MHICVNCMHVYMYPCMYTVAAKLLMRNNWLHSHCKQMVRGFLRIVPTNSTVLLICPDRHTIRCLRAKEDVPCRPREQIIHTEFSQHIHPSHVPLSSNATSSILFAFLPFGEGHRSSFDDIFTLVNEFWTWYCTTGRFFKSERNASWTHFIECDTHPTC